MGTLPEFPFWAPFHSFPTHPQSLVQIPPPPGRLPGHPAGNELPHLQLVPEPRHTKMNQTMSSLTGLTPGEKQRCKQTRAPSMYFRWTWVQVLIPLLADCLVLDKMPYHPEPQFLHL